MGRELVTSNWGSERAANQGCSRTGRQPARFGEDLIWALLGTLAKLEKGFVGAVLLLQCFPKGMMEFNPNRIGSGPCVS